MRRLYASLSTAARTCPQTAAREGMNLFRQLLAIVVAKGARLPILDAVGYMPLTRNIDVQLVADTINAATSRPIDVQTTSNRVVTSIEQRYETPDGKSARLDVLFYWDRKHDAVLVRLEGDPEALLLCAIDTLWLPADAGYCARPGDPLGLAEAVAAAADHG